MPKRPGTYKARIQKTDRHQAGPTGNGSWREGKTTAQRGYGGRWQKARETFLKRNPLCVYCERGGRLTPAAVVDHIIPHQGDQALFWDTSNWQPLCKPHHDSAKAREEARARSVTPEGEGGSKP